MSMKLLSRGETNENNSFNNPKIEGEEQPVNENAFETEYLIEYKIDISTPKNSLAKTYEDKNEMIAILEVPKADYKNENIQKLLKWARTKVREDDYYRDIAVYVQMAETFERSIVFTHAEISINERTYTKSDFVTMIVTINQKRDKFAGVMFGDDIDSTYKKAWQKVLNPPRLNIYIPTKSRDNKEFASIDGNIELLNNTEIDNIVQEIVDSINKDSNSVFELIEKDSNGDITVKLKEGENFDFKLVCSPFSKIFGEEISIININPIVPDLI